MKINEYDNLGTYISEKKEIIRAGPDDMVLYVPGYRSVWGADEKEIRKVWNIPENIKLYKRYDMATQRYIKLINKLDELQVGRSFEETLW